MIVNTLVLKEKNILKVRQPNATHFFFFLSMIRQTMQLINKDKNQQSLTRNRLRLYAHYS